MDHKDHPVLVTVETELCAGWPLVSDGPQHDHPIQLTEGIPSINEKKSPFFISLTLVPQF
jgi:hypothetical protein